MKNTLNKTIVIYCTAALFAFIFDKVYSLFSHGVSSDSMSYMYIWLLVCGVLAFTIIRIIFKSAAKQKGFRLFYNLYNSGVAVLITGMLLQGILEIAGGSSDYIQYYYYTAYGFMGLSIPVFGRLLFRRMKKTDAGS